MARVLNVPRLLGGRAPCAADLDDAVGPMVDAVVAALRSGRSVRDGLDAASDTGPLASPLRDLLVRAESVPLRDALVGWGNGHASSAVRLAVAAMVISLDTGGAQAVTLERVARRARDRAAISREIRAASAAARVSAVVIACTPVAFGLVVALLDSAVVAAAMRSPLGRACVLLGLVLQAVGLWWMRRLVEPRSLLSAYGSDSVAELADLLSLALVAGLDPVAAITAVAPHLGDDVGRVLRVSVARLTAGGRFTDEIANWPASHMLGADARPLVGALTATYLGGAPVVAVIDQLATDLRHAQRQAVNERVQRLPVVLLFPLVGCVLPAFVLLAVMPLAFGSVSAMRGG